MKTDTEILDWMFEYEDVVEGDPEIRALVVWDVYNKKTKNYDNCELPVTGITHREAIELAMSKSN